MKTAIINTEFWEDDNIFELNSDTRLFYLALLTNPKRNTTNIFKCSDRLLVAYTGYDIKLIELLRKQLIGKGFIDYYDGYYFIKNQYYIKASKGKLTKNIENNFLEDLPKKVKEVFNLLDKSSGVAQEQPQEYNNNNNNNNNNKEKKKKYGIHKNVLLTEKEYQKIIDDNLEFMIDIFSDGIAIKNYGYKNHNLALRKWSKNQTQSKRPKGIIAEKGKYDYLETKEHEIRM